MEFSATWVWLIAGVALGGLEIVTGTFYLLVLGVACLAGALVARLGCSVAWQIAAAAVLVVAGCMIVHRMRKNGADDVSRRLQNPDEGQSVTVQALEADGSADVMYRGSHWKAYPESGKTLFAGAAEIVRVDGARLVIRMK